MKTILFSSMLFLFVNVFSQQITVDTSYTSDVEGEVEQYWNWAAGVTVVGEGFSPSSTITIHHQDPNDFSWRDFTGTSNAEGGFSIVVNAMKMKSPLGVYTVTANDEANNEAVANYSSVPNSSAVIDIEANPIELTINELINGSGVEMVATGITPNALVKLNLSDPSSNGWEIDPTTDKYADENGSLTYILDGATPIGGGGNQIDQIPGVWGVSFNDFSGSDFDGGVNFRVLPNPGDAICIPSITIQTQPITKVEFSELSNSSSVDSTLGYEDFTDQIANVQAGETYTLKVQGKAQWSYNVNTYTAFIDWNQNGILDEDGEVYSLGFLVGSTGEDGMQVEFDITVPENASNGETRMRILKVNSPSTFAMFWPEGSCGNFLYGQVEDYTLNIDGGVVTPDCSIICSEDITVQAEEGEITSMVEYEVSFECSNDEGVELVLVEGLESGEEFPIGTTTITYNLVYGEEILDTCSFTITVDEYLSVSDLNKNEIKVYPNPVHDVLSLEYDQEISKISIVDLAGKQVLYREVNSKNSKVNVSTLPNGVYIVKAETESGTKTFKILKK